MNQNKILLRKTIIYAIGNFGSKVLTYLMVLLYSYYISPSELGYYDVIITTAAMLQPMITLQINDGIYRFMIEKNTSESLELLKTSRSFLLATTIIAEIIFAIIALFLNLKFTPIIMLYFFTNNIYIFYLDVIRGMNNSKLYALSGIFNSAIVLACEFVGLIFLHMGVEILLISKSVANIISIFLLIKFQNNIKSSFTFVINKTSLKEILSYSLPLVPNSICWWIVNFSDRYIILFLMGTLYNGIYSISNKFPTILTTVTGVFYLAWQETAMREYHGNERDKFYSSVFNNYYKLLLTLCPVMILGSRIVIELFMAIDYKTAWHYTGFLFLSAAFSALSSFLGIGYQISKETYRSILSTIGAALINFFVNIVLIKKIGLYAASFSTFIAYLFLMFIRFKHAKKYFSITVNWFFFFLLFVYNLLIILAVHNIDIYICIIVCIIATIIACISNINLLKKNKHSL